MLNNENKDENISMIYFDEMGLAEYSPNNPLKVIHSELEYDLNEGSKKVAFVGISNWSLDASKMNRGLFLSIPQPDLDDLKTTAKIIAESYNPQLAQSNLDLFNTSSLSINFLCFIPNLNLLLNELYKSLLSIFGKDRSFKLCLISFNIIVNKLLYSILS